MNKKQLAELLNGREIREEISKSEEKTAKENGLVVVYGYSDDNTELRGAINEEWGAYEGGVFRFTKTGKTPDSDVEEAIETIKEGGWEVDLGLNNQIEAVWSPTEPECSWIYKTEIPHETFDIMEDGELFCRGIIFSINDLK